MPSSPPSITAPPAVLVLAGNDPSGGAGLAADILTLSAFGCHPLPVVTAITVQDTAGMEYLEPVDAEQVFDQARVILEDVPVAAIKAGVLGSVENLMVLAEIAADYPDIPLVLDPVLATGAGHELASEQLIAAMREVLMPHVTLLTPNSIEARRLASDDPDAQEQMGLDEAALRLLASGARYVLITGTHEHTPQIINTLYGHGGRLRVDNWERLPGSYHGSGCTLASALAACLAKDMDLAEVVADAQHFTWQSLEAAFQLGMGQRVPDRLFWAQGSLEEGETEEEDEETAYDERVREPPVRLTR